MKLLNILFLLNFTCLIFSCHNNNKKENKNTKYNPNENIQIGRKVFTGTDSLEIYPFEMFYEVKLVQIDKCGMNTSIIFETNNKDTLIFYDYLNIFNYIFKLANLSFVMINGLENVSFGNKSS